MNDTLGKLNSSVMNTLGSLDSPSVNTWVSFNSPVMNTPGSQLLSVFGTSIRTGLQKNLLVTKQTRKLKLSSLLMRGESRLCGVFLHQQVLCKSI
jgi:hypothetical protein